jgi:ubiquinone/menaquinone biosynthesis C-methylase UbiE
LDGLTKRLLYKAYWLAFKACKMKGIIEADVQKPGISSNGPAQNSPSEHYIFSTKDVSEDRTKRYDYKKLVAEELDEYCNIEVTDDLREGGIHAFKAWEYWFAFLAKNVWKTDLFQEIIAFANSISNPKILSLGCGYGGHELNAAKSLSKPFEFIATDINPDIFVRAADEARSNNLNIQFHSADLNFIQIKEDSFDIIYAHASLHHIINLENLFLQIYKGLKREGRFFIVDMIGENRMLFWEENINFARNIVEQMPLKYKSRILDIDKVIRPGNPNKGMEGIRQEEIEAEILKYFKPIKCFKYGSFMRMLLTNPYIGENINPDIEPDKKYLEDLFKLDLQQIEEHRLRPTEMFAIFSKKNGLPPSY